MMMKIYNVLWEDRHLDVTATPFREFEDAKVWAKDQAKKYCHYEEDFREIPIKGRLYHVEYSCEGDCLWITEHEI